jgi:hypothetical protein
VQGAHVRIPDGAMSWLSLLGFRHSFFDPLLFNYPRSPPLTKITDHPQQKALKQNE